MEGSVFEIDGKNYNVVKRGREQARQVTLIGSWLVKHGAPTVRAIQGAEGLEDMSGIEVIGQALSTLSEDSLIDLFQVVFGCDKKVAEESFDIALLIDGAMAMYNGHPAIQKLVNRFFSGSTSTQNS